MAKGKYQEWLTADGLLLLEGWARDGLTDEQIATNMGIGVRTLYSYYDSFEQISQAVKKGRAPVDFIVENALFKRATGYDWEETTTEIDTNGKKHIKKITRHVPPDVGAIVFWLKNRRRDKWRDRPDLVQDNSGTNPILESIGDVLNRRRDERD